MNECDNPVNPLPTMPSTTFSVTGIHQQLSQSDTKKASGPNNIHLKKYVNKIAPILQVIFTKSLDTGVLLSNWLMVNVCPVYKKVTCTNNYRPISLTLVCSKTMEHMKYHSILGSPTIINSCILPYNGTFKL